MASCSPLHLQPERNLNKVTLLYNDRNVHIYEHTTVCKNIHTHIQGVSRLVDITAGGDFLGICDQKSSYNVSNFGRLRSYEHFLIPVHALV